MSRARRNSILKYTDCKMLSDYPTTKQSEWKTYRQELRDITITNWKIEDTVWPDKPEE